jgi:hypothetical protein
MKMFEVINEDRGPKDIMPAIARAIKDLKKIDPQGEVSDEVIAQAAKLSREGKAGVGKAAGLIIKQFDTTSKSASAQDVFDNFVDTFFPPSWDDPFSSDNLKRDKLADKYPRKSRY